MKDNTASHFLVNENKYWSIALHKNTTTIEYGTLGSQATPRQGTKTHKDSADAAKYVKDKVDEKLHRGYSAKSLSEAKTLLAEESKEEGIKGKINKVAERLDIEGDKRKSSDLEEDKKSSKNGKRKKLASIEERYMEIISTNKITLKPLLEQYKKNVSKYSVDYVENKRYNKYCSINVVGKELFIENGTRNKGKKIVKHTLESHQKAAEEGVEIISGKIAEGYQRLHKGKEYRIDYSKAKEESEDEVSREEEELEAGGTDVIVSDAEDDSYLGTIQESMADLEARYGYTG